MFHIPLMKDMFPSSERELIRLDDYRVTLFTFDSGVAGLRVTNSVGEVTFLPFQGQQIWDLAMFQRRQTMKSMFSRPRPHVPYLETYGGFLLHCGFTAMGGPGPEDKHPLHGELPNAPFDSAALISDEDEHGTYLALTGSYEYAHAFGAHYIATPEVRIYRRSGVLRVFFSAQNLNKVPMEYMYLAHANFRPVDNSVLEYTAPCDTDHVRVRSNIPTHLNVTPEYREFLKSLERDPQQHNRMDPALPFDPEAVLFLDMSSDKQGFCHSAQVLPTGEADIISYRPEQLPHGVRWICRTADQGGLGIILPATAEPDGYTAEKEKGNIAVLPPGETFQCEFYTGALSIPAAQRYRDHIRGTLAGTSDTINPVALDAESY
jgi:hypothetical protein